MIIIEAAILSTDLTARDGRAWQHGCANAEN